jgi:hypothetical protein
MAVACFMRWCASWARRRAGTGARLSELAPSARTPVHQGLDSFGRDGGKRCARCRCPPVRAAPTARVWARAGGRAGGGQADQLCAADGGQGRDARAHGQEEGRRGRRADQGREAPARGAPAGAQGLVWGVFRCAGADGQEERMARAPGRPRPRSASARCARGRAGFGLGDFRVRWGTWARRKDGEGAGQPRSASAWCAAGVLASRGGCVGLGRACGARGLQGQGRLCRPCREGRARQPACAHQVLASGRGPCAAVRTRSASRRPCCCVLVLATAVHDHGDWVLSAPSDLRAQQGTHKQPRRLCRRCCPHVGLPPCVGEARHVMLAVRARTVSPLGCRSWARWAGGGVVLRPLMRARRDGASCHARRQRPDRVCRGDQIVGKVKLGGGDIPFQGRARGEIQGRVGLG